MRRKMKFILAALCSVTGGCFSVPEINTTDPQISKTPNESRRKNIFIDSYDVFVYRTHSDNTPDLLKKHAWMEYVWYNKDSGLESDIEITRRKQLIFKTNEAFISCLTYPPDCNYKISDENRKYAGFRGEIISYSLPEAVNRTDTVSLYVFQSDVLQHKLIFVKHVD